ncbi:MAG: ATP-binding protein [Oscillospiraceae bacterium]
MVQDSGIGISSDDMEHIFDRFYRADTERDRSIGGTGLGLSIAKWIVDRHEGVFEVVSYQDIGTRITIRLPKQDGKKPKSEEETI